MGFALGGTVVSALQTSDTQINQSSSSHKNPGAETDAEKERHGTEKALVRYTLWLMIFTGVLAVATIVLGLATIGLYFTGKKQIGIAKQSADAAKASADALPMMEGASLFVTVTQDTVGGFAKSGFFDNTESMFAQEINPSGLSYQFKNLGRTPAIIQEIGERVIASADTPDSATNPPLVRPHLDELIIEPGKEGSIYVCTGRDKFTVGDAVRFQKEKLDIWFNGFVRYVDTFKRVHRFEYRFRYHRGWGRFRLVYFHETIEKEEKST